MKQWQGNELCNHWNSKLNDVREPQFALLTVMEGTLGVPGKQRAGGSGWPRRPSPLLHTGELSNLLLHTGHIWINQSPLLFLPSGPRFLMDDFYLKAVITRVWSAYLCHSANHMDVIRTCLWNFSDQAPVHTLVIKYTNSFGFIKILSINGPFVSQ